MQSLAIHRRTQWEGIKGELGLAMGYMPPPIPPPPIPPPPPPPPAAGAGAGTGAGVGVGAGPGVGVVPGGVVPGGKGVPPGGVGGAVPAAAVTLIEPLRPTTLLASVAMTFICPPKGMVAGMLSNPLALIDEIKLLVTVQVYGGVPPLAVNCKVCPTLTVFAGDLTVIAPGPGAGAGPGPGAGGVEAAACTVTFAVFGSVIPFELTIMVAAPTLTAVTIPVVAPTRATLMLDDAQLYVGPPPVAVKVLVSFTVNVTWFGTIANRLTDGSITLTLTTKYAPLASTTPIRAVPSALALSTAASVPALLISILAIEVLLDDHRYGAWPPCTV